MSLRNYEERKEFAEKVVHESTQVKALFKRLFQQPAPVIIPYQFPNLALIYQISDHHANMAEPVVVQFFLVTL